MRGGRFLPEVRKRETRTFVSSLPNRTFSRPVPELCGSTPDGDWHHATSVRFLPQGPRYRRERAFRRPRPFHGFPAYPGTGPASARPWLRAARDERLGLHRPRHGGRPSVITANPRRP